MKNKFKTIIISDLHLGTKDSKSIELVEFLEKNKCENLILNGDIIDGWAIKRGSRWRNKDMKCIRKLIKLTEKGTHITWIRGNHDDFLKDFIPFTIDKFKILEDLTYYGINNKKYLILHGDIFDVFVTKMGWVAKIGSIGYDLALWVNRWYNKYRTWRGLPYDSLSKRIKNSVKKAVNFINDFENYISTMGKKEGYDGVICGHIHHPEIKNIDGIDYMNSGDWVENLTALVENYDGTWEIIYKN
jgi:UDP-2,3-diacylglucosamine pyrophosphatase LpxH